MALRKTAALFADLLIGRTDWSGYFQSNTCRLSNSNRMSCVKHEYAVTWVGVIRKYDIPLLTYAMGDEIIAVPARCRASSGSVIQMAAEISYHASKVPTLS